jgi:integrase
MSELYQRNGAGPWYYDFRLNKKRYNASTKLSNKGAAIAFVAALRTRIQNQRVGINPIQSDPVSDLLKTLEGRWEGEGKLSAPNRSTLKSTEEYWGKRIAQEISVLDLERFVQARIKEGYRPASVNRWLQCLRRAFNIAGIDWPDYALAKEENVREGIATAEQIRAVLAELPDDGLRDFIDFVAATGMRKGQAAQLRWSHLQHGVLLIPGKFTKNRKPHLIPTEPFVELIERRKAARSFQRGGAAVLSEFIFHRGNGLRIKEFRKTWASATKRANLGGLLVHDLRRAAISDMLAAGVPTPTAMKISGHRTVSTFHRYAISDVEDVSQALKKTAEFRKRVS